MYDLIGKFLTGAIWAIDDEMRKKIFSIYTDRLHGIKADIPSIEAALGRPLRNEQPDTYALINGVAVIDIVGVISKRMSLFTRISGGASVEKITDDFNQALDDPAVKAIVLKVDSPGGVVDGVFELAETIFTARDKKPCFAVAYGTMASAAYLIGSAALKVYASDVMASVGSLGVVAVHEDTSAIEKTSGVITTEIYRGKYKRIVGSGPLTEEGRKSIEDKVDYAYSLLIDAVARYRGVSSDEVLTKMSTDVTDYFIGAQAVEAGLADGIANIDTAVTLALSQTQQAGYYTMSGGYTSGKEKSMSDKDLITTIEQLAAAYPALVTAIREQAVSTVDVKGPATQAAEAEKTRVLGLATGAFGEKIGAEFAAIVNTGVTVEQLKAIRGSTPFIAQEAGKEAASVAKEKEKLLAAITDAGASPVGAGDGKDGNDKDFMTLVEEHMSVNKTTKFMAMQAVRAKYPDKHEAYITQANAPAGRKSNA